MNTYYIHDNCCRPFKVEIEENTVKVFKMLSICENSEELNYENKPILTFKPKNIFIGESPRNDMTEFSGGYGDLFYGNSILLHLKDNIYVFIGKYIYEFNSVSKIVYYNSPVGNNDVPYPYAVDVDKNYYLLIEKIMIQIPHQFRELDPYQYYYENKLTDDLSISKRFRRSFQNASQLPKFQRNFQGITKFFLGNEQYTLSYSSNASENYGRLRSDFGKVYIVKNGKKFRITKRKYVKIMKDFETMYNYRKINDIKIIE